MADGNFDKRAADRAAAETTPLAELNPGLPDRFATDSFWPVFERLRREDPVHYTAESEWGPYWSVTKFEDIVAVDTNHQAFSSDAHLGGNHVERHRVDATHAEQVGGCVEYALTSADLHRDDC